MHDETIWLDPDVTEESLRFWAYNDNAQFDFQDEDLLLHRAGLFHLLIPMIEDPSCPKATYILSCLDDYLISIARHSNTSYLTTLEQAIICCLGSSQQHIKDWAALQVRRLRYRTGLGPISREQGLQIGQDLLIGFSSSFNNWEVRGELHVVSESLSQLVMERTWEGQRFREFLAVDLHHGTIKFYNSLQAES